MKCNHCGHVVTGETFNDMQVNFYRHTMEKHPAVWNQFMDWVLS